jgi:hypothetical protein
MIAVQTGQCGTCAHFGEGHKVTPELQQIRTTSRASELYTDTCGHPMLAKVRLRVTAVSGCDACETVRTSSSDTPGEVAPR